MTLVVPVPSATSQVASMKVDPETRKLVLVMRCGDITTVSLNDEGDGELRETEVEGTVEPGILAAAWSPDDTVIALITGTLSSHVRWSLIDMISVGEEKLIIMTSTFDVLSEAPLHTNEFGEGATRRYAQLELH